MEAQQYGLYEFVDNYLQSSCGIIQFFLYIFRQYVHYDHRHETYRYWTG